MANRRVQVERLRMPTSITPTASPVDTYVAPAQQSLAPSRGMQILQALAPAVETVSKIKFDESEKERLRLEAEARDKAKLLERQRVAFEAEKALTQANAEWESHYTENSERMLTEGKESAQAERAEFFGQRLANISDPEVKLAVDRDFQIGGIKFDLALDKELFTRRTNQAVESIFTSIHSTKATGAPFNDQLNTDMLRMSKLYNVPMKDLNDTAMVQALYRVKQGDVRLWEYMKTQKQHLVGDEKRQQVVAAIEDELASQAKASATAGKKQLNSDLEKQAEAAAVKSVLEQGTTASALPFYYNDADGERKEISPTRMVNLAQKSINERTAERLTSLLSSPDENVRANAYLITLNEHVQQYARLGLTDEKSKATLEKGLALLTADMQADPMKVISDAQQSYTLFNTMHSINEKYTQDLIGGEEFKAFRAIKTLMVDQGDTFEQAFYKVRSGLQGEGYSAEVASSHIVKAMENLTDGGWFSDDVTNTGDVYSFVKRNAEAYMRYNGLSPELAVKAAEEDYANSHTRISNRMVDITGIKMSPDLPDYKVENMFNLLLGDFPEGYGIKRVAGQTDRFVIIDEVGNLAYQLDKNEQLLPNSFSIKQMQSIFHSAELLRAENTAQAALENAQIEEEVDALVALERAQDNMYADTWTHRWILKQRILSERKQKELEGKVIVGEQVNPDAIQNY